MGLPLCGPRAEYSNAGTAHKTDSAADTIAIHLPAFVNASPRAIENLRLPGCFAPAL